MSTTIQWTDETWNPVRGCSLVSAGCANCYAMKQAHRFSGPGRPYDGLTELGPQGPRWTGKIRLVPEVLELPLRWKKPRRIFVNSMSDLFHPDIPREWIKAVVGIAADCPQHTLQILTKRPHRMLEFCRECPVPSNCWLGVSVEDRKTADERIPLLLQTPAAVRWISAEPLLGPVDIRAYTDYGSKVGDNRGLDWVVVGGESGPGARPCDLAWIRLIVEQCRVSDVPVFVKQLGSYWAKQCQCGNAVRGYNDSDRSVRHDYDKKGGDPAEWPSDLRVREWPR